MTGGWYHACIGSVEIKLMETSGCMQSREAATLSRTAGLRSMGEWQHSLADGNLGVGTGKGEREGRSCGASHARPGVHPAPRRGCRGDRAAYRMSLQVYTPFGVLNLCVSHSGCRQGAMCINMTRTAYCKLSCHRHSPSVLQTATNSLPSTPPARAPKGSDPARGQSIPWPGSRDACTACPRSPGS